MEVAAVRYNGSAHRKTQLHSAGVHSKPNKHITVTNLVGQQVQAVLRRAFRSFALFLVYCWWYHETTVAVFSPMMGVRKALWKAGMAIRSHKPNINTVQLIPCAPQCRLHSIKPRNKSQARATHNVVCWMAYVRIRLHTATT